MLWVRAVKQASSSRFTTPHTMQAFYISWTFILGTPLQSLQKYYTTRLNDMLSVVCSPHNNKALMSLGTLKESSWYPGREQGLGTHSRPKEVCGLEARARGLLRRRASPWPTIERERCHLHHPAFALTTVIFTTTIIITTTTIPISTTLDADRLLAAFPWPTHSFDLSIPWQARPSGLPISEASI